ncbi:hypothetical protein HU200_050542 [Digitaria exilis]|uniref:Integrase catalytic domain-containing protein n=1 Tax=Digitaria exilis TaxID=1010633 RepID=A0A835AMP8_9POAL|nr:hypothetical protein HU200_050542 [Digitaria exilis]
MGGSNRPSMKEITDELGRLRKLSLHPGCSTLWMQHHIYSARNPRSGGRYLGCAKSSAIAQVRYGPTWRGVHVLSNYLAQHQERERELDLAVLLLPYPADLCRISTSPSCRPSLDIHLSELEDSVLAELKAEEIVVERLEPQRPNPPSNRDDLAPIRASPCSPHFAWRRRGRLGEEEREAAVGEGVMSSRRRWPWRARGGGVHDGGVEVVSSRRRRPWRAREGDDHGGPRGGEEWIWAAAGHHLFLGLLTDGGRRRGGGRGWEEAEVEGARRGRKWSSNNRYCPAILPTKFMRDLQLYRNPTCPASRYHPHLSHLAHVGSWIAGPTDMMPVNGGRARGGPDGEGLKAKGVRHLRPTRPSEGLRAKGVGHLRLARPPRGDSSGPAHIFVLVNTRCEMVGLGDRQFRLGATIRFGSLEFLVDELPTTHGGAPHLVLVNDSDCMATRAGQVPRGNQAVPSAESKAASAARATTAFSRSSIIVSRVGRERIVHHPDSGDNSTQALRAKHSGQSAEKVDVRSLKSEASALPFGLKNTSQVFFDLARRQAWKGLDRAHAKVRLLKYEGILGRYAAPDRGIWKYTSPGTSECCPTWECFTVVPPDDLTNGANGTEIWLTPEQIAAKRQELEDVRLALELEQAQLDANMEPAARARAHELFDRASQCIAAAMLLSRQLPQPSTHEERRVQNGLKTLLERATVQQAESSAGRRRYSGVGARDSRSPSPVDKKKPTDAQTLQRSKIGWALTATCGIPSRLDDRIARRNRRIVSRVHVEAEEDWDSSSDSDCLGLAAFSHEIRTVAIPPWFRLPTNFSKYDGETDPSVWLDDFKLACRAGALTKREDLNLGGLAEYLRRKLPRHLRLPGQEYLCRFSRQYNNLPDATDADALAALMGGTKSRILVNRIGKECPKTIKEVLDIATEEAQGEEARRDEPADEAGPPDCPEKKKKKKKKERQGDPLDPRDGRHKVNNEMTDPKDDDSPRQLLEGPCPNHATPIKHKYRECGLMRKFLMGRLDRVSPTSQTQGKGTTADTFLEPDECLMIFGGPEAQASKRHGKLMEHDVFTVHPTNQEYLRWFEASITFDHSDHPKYVSHPGKLPLVVASIIGKKRVSKVLMDGEGSLNILYASTLDALGWAPFYGVVPGKEAIPLGQITLPVPFGDRDNFYTEMLCFEVVDFDGSYDAILGRPCYAKFMAVPNYVYLKLKMPGPNCIIMVGTSPQAAYECEKESCALAAALVASRQLAKARTTVEASKELAVSQAAIDAIAEQASALEDQEGRAAQSDDGPTRKRAMREPETERQFHPSSDTKKESALIDCLRANIGMFAWVPADMPGIPREVAEHSLDIHQDAKPVRQPTRRCNEFKRKIIIEEVAKLLDAGFIREVVDSTAGCEALCFLDAYSGYHQNALKESDQLATSFMTPCGIYVDDIVVKSKRADDLVQDLEATFDRLGANRVKLNPEKCMFGVSKGLLLGFVVSARGIEPNPEKIAAITNMGPLSSVKDVQKLAGCLAALGRFVSRLGERGLPLCKLLKRQALDQLKHMLTEPPILRLFLYVAATTQVVSAVLVVEREEEGHALKIQHPVYYISEVLTESKTRYLHIQKMVYAILIAQRKLRHYFDAHHVTVVTEHALGEVINNREATGRIAKWSLKLTGYGISYTPRSTIKSQVLVDFVAEWTETQLPPPQPTLKTRVRVGVVFISPMGVMMRYAIRLHFPTSNNMAEYEALLAGLRIAKELGIHRLEARGDCRLVVDQVNGDAKCHNPKLAVYCEAARRAQEKFRGLGFVHLRREYNKVADDDSRFRRHRPSVDVNDEASTSGSNREQLPGPHGSLDPSRVVAAIARTNGGPTPYPESKAYRIIEGDLYRRGHNGVLQSCIPNEEGRSLSKDIHEGVCGHHTAPRSLGFYWPTVVTDAERIVRTCEGCQFYAKKTHLSAQALQTIPITWLFAVQGLDMVGPLPRAPGGFTHMFVTVDKSTKWIEARPLTKITSVQAVSFFHDILCQFGVPNTNIIDNGTQFTGKKFTRFCDDHEIEVAWAAVAHPRTNGQVERANGMVLQGLKPQIFSRLVKCIHKLGAKWVEELPSVLWSLRTTPTCGTSFSPFYMVYGTEAILPTDIDYGSLRVQAFDEEGNAANLEDIADQLEEAREVAVAQLEVLPRATIGDLVLRLAQDRRGFTKLSPPWEGPYTVARVLRPAVAALLPVTTLSPDPHNGVSHNPCPADTEGKGGLDESPHARLISGSTTGEPFGGSALETDAVTQPPETRLRGRSHRRKAFGATVTASPCYKFTTPRQLLKPSPWPPAGQIRWVGMSGTATLRQPMPPRLRLARLPSWTAGPASMPNRT